MNYLQIWPESGAVELPVGATNCTARGGKRAPIVSFNIELDSLTITFTFVIRLVTIVVCPLRDIYVQITFQRWNSSHLKK